MFIANIQQKIEYKCNVAKNIIYDAGIKTRFYYTMAIEAIKSLMGRLGYYDPIDLEILDKYTLGEMDELKE